MRGTFEVSNTAIGSDTGAQVVFPLNTIIGRAGSDYPSIGYNGDLRAGSNGTTGIRYLVTDTISQLSFNSGGFIFRGAPSGAAGTTATLTETFRINRDGTIGVGTGSALRITLGDEKWKPAAEKEICPLDFLTLVLTTIAVPSS